MRFRIGAPPRLDAWDPAAEGWTRLAEPSGWGFQASALAVGLVLAAASVLLWAWLTPYTWREIDFLYVLIGIPLVVPLHELVHGLGVPRARGGDVTYFGFSPRHVGFYVHYTGALPRWWWLAIGALPTLVLSVAPLAVCAVWRIRSPWLLYLSISNALAACGDWLGIGIGLARIPQGAAIRQQGTETWWRMREQEGREPAGKP